MPQLVINSQFWAAGIPGECASPSAPQTVNTRVLGSTPATEQYNVFSAAFTQSTTNPLEVQVGGTGSFAGLLVNPKETVNYGSSSLGGALDVSMSVANGTISTDFATGGEWFVNLTLNTGVTLAPIGNGADGHIGFNQDTGELIFYTGTAPTGVTEIPSAKIAQRPVNQNGLAVIWLWEGK